MIKTVFTLLTALGFTLFSTAQIGSIDPAFKPGTGFGPDEWTGRCESIIQQPDGKLLVGGQFKSFNGDPAFYITRLNLDGSRDQSFESPFKEHFGANVHDIALQTDGKIIIAGYFSQFNDRTDPQWMIARLHASGRLDTTFKVGSGFTHEINSIAIQPDGKIVVGGLFTEYDFQWNGQKISCRGIARLNTDGSFDHTFQTGTGFAGAAGIGQVNIYKVRIQNDGKILVAGHFSTYNNTPALLMARLNTDGSLDNAFNTSNSFTLVPFTTNYGQVWTMEVLPNGKIMIGGNYLNSSYNNPGTMRGVDRLNADGSIDTTFKGFMLNGYELRCSDLDVQSDGKILAGVQYSGFDNYDITVFRMLPDGDFDSTFALVHLNDQMTDLEIQQDGNVVFVGYFNYNPQGIMRVIGDASAPATTAEYGNLPFHFNAYPNPATDMLKIQHAPHNVNVQIVDLYGRVVLTRRSFNPSQIIDISSLTGGTYLLQIEHNGILKHKKFVVSE